jgi:riboflavin synthase
VDLFTGLIECTGKVKSIFGERLTIESGDFRTPSPGDSIAVDGSCLTVDGILNRVISFHCSRETISRTIVSGYYPGVKVNLERPLELKDGLHGHIVTGHVDESSSVLKVERSGSGMTAWISFSSRYGPLLVEKGSVSVSGISLTVASVLPGKFSVAVIPETLDRTTAGAWKPGSHVNLEFDIIGKYVKKQIDSYTVRNRLREYIEQ